MKINNNFDINKNATIYEILDVDTNTVIVRDECVRTKKEPFCISFDEKYFFNSNSKKFIITRLDILDKQKIPYNQNIVNSYKIGLWRNNKRTKNVDVFREFDINELDEGVKQLVHALNTIDGVDTRTSCDGHGIRSLWVAMLCKNFLSICFLSDCITNEMFSDFFSITFEENTCKNTLYIKITTKRKIKGDIAYRKANLLAKYIKCNYANFKINFNMMQSSDYINIFEVAK